LIREIVLAISGASGSIYGLRALEVLLSLGLRVHLLISETAYQVIKLELALDLSSGKDALLAYLKDKRVDFDSKQLQLWNTHNLAASCSSGSHLTAGMLIAPCSAGTLGRIASGVSGDLIARSADVCLKEKRRLVLMLRETPLNDIQLENMLKVSRSGGVILPASPAFYHQPESIDDLIDFVLGKALDSLKIEHALFRRWG